MHTRSRKTLFLFPLCLLLLCCSMLLARDLQQKRNTLSMEYQRAEALMIKPQAMEILSGDFKGIVADYLLLKAAHFIGGAYKPSHEDWQTIATLYKQVLQLDPFFFSAIYYAQGTLAWVKDMATEVNEMLKISHVTRNWDWQPGFYLGFNTFYFLGQHELAAKYLKESADRSGAPLFVPFLAAKMNQKAGRTRTSIFLLQTMLENTKEDYARREIQRRLLAYQGILQIEQAIELYKKENGNNPELLTELVTSGYIDDIPANPYGKRYWYDAVSGSLFFLPQKNK